MRSFLLLAALLVQDAQRPVFRAGVDLVAIDVVVLDRAGRPVEDLRPADFVVTAGGRARTLMSAEYLRAVPAGRPVTRTEPRTPATSSNLSAAGGRSFVFVVDVERIRAGEGRSVMAAISTFVDGLSPSDRVGLVALPDGTPRVDLTVDHELVRGTAERVAGRSTAGRDSAMSLGEADGIRRGDTKALVAYWERTEGRARCLAPGRPIEEPVSVPAACAQLASEDIEPHRTHARTRLDALGALAEALAPAPGPKTLVLVTEGLLHDEDTVDDVRRFAAIAERARVTLYGLHLQVPPNEASSGRSATAGSRAFDERLGFDGLAEAAHVARGTAFRVIADAAPVLARVDAETSGSYLLAFAPDDGDRRSTDLTIEVRVRREGVDVRARRRATVPAVPPSPAPAPPAGPGERRRLMGELLARVAPMAEVPIHVATFVTPPRTGGAGALVLVIAEIDAPGTPVAAVGYEVHDEAGEPVADTFDDPPSFRALDNGRVQYAIGLPLGAGRYRLELGAIDSDGRRGSVEHSFAVAAWPGGIRASDLLIGDESSGGFRPLAHIGAGPALIVRLELAAETAGALAGATATIRIERLGETSPPEIVPIPVLESADAGRRVVTTRLDRRAFRPGQYRLTVAVTTATGETLTRSRLLTVPGDPLP